MPQIPADKVASDLVQLIASVACEGNLIINAVDAGRRFFPELPVVIDREALNASMRALVTSPLFDPNCLAPFFGNAATALEWLIELRSLIDDVNESRLRRDGVPPEWDRESFARNIKSLTKKWKELAYRKSLQFPAQPAGDDGAAVGGDLPRRMKVEEANANAMKLLQEYGKAFFVMSLTKQAELIGCHCNTWKKTPLYLEAVKDGRISAPKTRAPKTVSLTDRVEAVTGQGEKNGVQSEAAQAELQRLIAECKNDAEPSPLDDDPPNRQRKVHARKQL
jgi:hypothetical protein